MRRAGKILLIVVAAGVIVWLFPLFHVARLDGNAATKGETVFNASEFATTFWNSKLMPALNQSPDVVTVLAAFNEDGATARDKFGRKIGVSRTSLLVVRGSGRIVSIDKQGIGVAVTEGSQEADVVLKTGLVFGNIVRDATGLLDASAFNDSRQLNEISVELNRIVEARVVQKLKDTAKVGRQVSFAGCAEIPDEASSIHPLAIIPLETRVE